MKFEVFCDTCFGRVVPVSESSNVLLNRTSNATAAMLFNSLMNERYNVIMAALKLCGKF